MADEQSSEVVQPADGASDLPAAAVAAELSAVLVSCGELGSFGAG